MSRLTELFRNLPWQVSLETAYHKESGETEPETGRPIIEEATACFSFSEPGFGFGEFAIVQRGNEVFIDAETMSKERVMKYLERLIDNAILDTDDDPMRHKRYNEVMKRTCGEGCKICR